MKLLARRSSIIRTLNLGKTGPFRRRPTRRRGFVAGEKRQGVFRATSGFFGGGPPVLPSPDSFLATSPSGKLHLRRIPRSKRLRIQKQGILLSGFVVCQERGRKRHATCGERRYKTQTYSVSPGRANRHALFVYAPTATRSNKAGVNALELKAMVTGKRVGAPPTLLQKYPELRRFADPAEEFDGPASPQIAAARLKYVLAFGTETLQSGSLLVASGNCIL